MDRDAIRATVRKGIETHERKSGSTTPDFANLVECIVDEFLTEQEEALQLVIELYPEAEPLLRALRPKR